MVTNYDRAGDTYISPSRLNKAVNDLADLAESVGDSIDRIDNTLDKLALGWAGKTRQESENFSNRWNEVMRDLFGTKEDPNRGVLNRIANQVGTAARNYNRAEGGLADLWAQFGAKLSGDGGSEQSPAITPQDEMDTSKTFITADYPNN